MKKIYAFLLLARLLPAGLLEAQPCREVVGYYPDWQWYDRSQLVRPLTIDYSKYTIINYCFFNPQPNGTITLGDAWAEENLLQGQINWSTTPPSYYPNTSIVDRAHNANVKVLVSIGGWTWSDNFPAIAADPQKRATFAHDCNHYVEFYNLDGIDIDWEYPGFADHNGTPADIVNYSIFLQQIRDSLNALGQQHNEQYLLTAAVGAAAAHMSNVQWGQVSNILDMINLMSYDFFGAWDAAANHNSPLYPATCGDPAFNIDGAFTALTQTHGVPAGKINIGVAFYGRSQTGYTSLCGPTAGTAATSAFPPDGVPLYYDIVANMNSYTSHWDNAAQVPWLSGNGVFLSYDDEQSIALKAQYINSRNARGAIIWEITGDYLETAPGSGVVAGTPLADTLNAVFCSGITGMPETAVPPHFSLFPNPSSGSVYLETGNGFSGMLTVHIFDAAGREMATQRERVSAGQPLPLYSADKLPAGVYSCSLEAGDGLRQVLRLVLLR